MTIAGLFVLIIVIGLAVWLINTYVPLPPPFKQIITIVGVILVIVIILQAFGIIPSINQPVPRVN